MILSEVSVKRPVFACVLSLLLVCFGILSFRELSLREYPQIDPPIVTVEVNYPGAPANIVETRITQLVEDRISGVEGIESIQSSSKDGESTVTIEFDIERDIDAAANDVRDRVAGLQDNLPEEAESPEVQKVDSSNDVVIWQNLASDRMTVPELTDYARRYLVDQYSTLDGVARVRVGGAMNYALRIWPDRQEMTARGIVVSDIEKALRVENIELPSGSMQSEQMLFKARIKRNFQSPEDFEKIVLGTGKDGHLIRLGEVAKIELGVEEDRTFFRGNGVPMVGIGVIRQSTANTIDVAAAVKNLTAKLNKNLPEGMSIEQSYDASVFISASIKEVYQTLFVAILCVVAVLYIFLRNIRAMLIPAVTVPVSLIATFILVYAFGFSINILTLLAMILAIGIVVDDAIVMIENIVRRIQDYDETPLVASFKGSKQVGFAIVATTLVLIAVFIPITFMKGDIGRLFTEFAITISVCVIFSSVVALTLCPMLASVWVKRNTKTNIEGTGFFLKFRNLYIKSLQFILKNPVLVVVVFFILGGLSYWGYTKLPQEFAPKEDRGAFFLIVNGPEGASHEFMAEYMDEIERRMMPYVESGEVKRLLVRTPRSFGNIESFNTGMVIVLLEDWSARRPAAVIIGEVRKKMADLSGVRAFPVMRQGLGGGRQKPVQFVLGGSTYEELAEWRDVMLNELRKDNPGLQGIDSDYKETRPQIDFEIIYDRAASLGVTTEEIGSALETMMGGRRVTTFLKDGEEYDVIVEGDRKEQTTFNEIANIHVRSARTGAIIPISNLVNIDEYGASEELLRYNRIRSITLEANLSDDLALGDALRHMEAVAREHLPDTAIIDFKGVSKDFMESRGSMGFVFLMGIFIVYLVLAAQFESIVLPFVIILTVPLAIGGGVLAIFALDGTLNIYTQIGLIILVAIAAKNGILIVEFANQLRSEGRGFQEALQESVATRFRPIIMTGMTTFAGTIPLIFASGAGAETRIIIGATMLGGVFAATIFTLYIVPSAYSILGKKTKHPEYVSQKLEKELNQ